MEETNEDKLLLGKKEYHRQLEVLIYILIHHLLPLVYIYSYNCKRG